MPTPKRKFSSLLTEPPKPLPDDDEPPVRQAPPLAQQPASARRASAARPEPDPPQAQPAATSARAAMTIRLHASAAEPLNTAWLNERRLRDPKLSYPEFASMIVRLGLTAYEKQQARQS